MRLERACLLELERHYMLRAVLQWSVNFRHYPLYGLALQLAGLLSNRGSEIPCSTYFVNWNFAY